MNDIINLFSPDQADFGLEEYKDKLPRHLYAHLEQVLTGNPGDILRPLLWEKQFMGAIKLAYFKNKQHVGFIRCLTVLPSSPGLPSSDPKVFQAALEKVLEEFMSLCFGICEGLNEICWNVHPAERQLCKACLAIAFKELPASQAYVEHGMRYRSFIRKR